MAFIMLRDIAKNIIDYVFFSTLADKVTDSSNNEQLVVCIRLVDNNFEAHKNFIGIHAVENISQIHLLLFLKIS